jgi:hypothetical protein
MAYEKGVLIISLKLENIIDHLLGFHRNIRFINPEYSFGIESDSIPPKPAPLSTPDRNSRG